MRPAAYREGRRSRISCALLGALVVGLTTSVVGGGRATADTTGFVPVTGAGSTWSENALDQWIANVQPDGIRINYAGTGSTAGRQAFLNGTVDFAASDIPFQTKPDDGSAPEQPVPGSYAYMPITAGGTVFMYNLKINGQRVTNLRLSGQNIAKIFTGAITNWSNPAIATDNPGLHLPNEPIVPVVRSDGAGDSFEFSQWMISQYPSVWNAFCNTSGRAPACGPTSFYPTVSGMIAQSGDLGVAGYVSQNFAAGAIGYVNYSYAIDDGFPVAQMLNAAGYYTEPTPQNVAVSLLQAQIETANTDPSVYLTENLQNVWTDPDPRTYPLSSYSYLILPITVAGQFTAAKGKTLAFFANYAMCQGQSDISVLGYSPVPANLVEASFTQIARIPGAVAENTNIQDCKNPTFSTATGINVNLLAQTAPDPPACDKQGPTQCSTGTGGAQNVSTPVSAAARAPTTTKAATRALSTGTVGSAAEVASGSTAQAVTSTTAPASCDPATCAVAATISSPTSDPRERALLATTATLPTTKGWSSTQTVMVLVLLALLTVILAPRLLARRTRRGTPS